VKTRFAKFMDWLTNEPPEAELPEDFKYPVYIPKVAVVVGSEANPEKVEIPTRSMTPWRMRKSKRRRRS
jgi:hypothetical protein